MEPCSCGTVLHLAFLRANQCHDSVYTFAAVECGIKSRFGRCQPSYPFFQMSVRFHRVIPGFMAQARIDWQLSLWYRACDFHLASFGLGHHFLLRRLRDNIIDEIHKSCLPNCNIYSRHVCHQPVCLPLLIQCSSTDTAVLLSCSTRHRRSWAAGTFCNFISKPRSKYMLISHELMVIKV